MIGLSGCSLLLGVLSHDFCITFCTTAHPLSLKLVIQEVGEICAEGERTGFSKMIPLRDVFQQCVMYNTCSGMCNKQQGGVVRSPTGRPWTSAPRQANCSVKYRFFFFCQMLGSYNSNNNNASKTMYSLTISFCFPVSIILSR